MTDVSENIDGGTPQGDETSLSGALGDLCLLISEQLQDEFGLNWPPSKMVPYLNLFLLETINLKPEAYPVEETITLVSGHRQALGATDIDLLDSLYNVMGSGTTEAIVAPTLTIVKKKAMDYALPGWPAYTPATLVNFIVKDENNPQVFYVYPPNDGNGKVKLLVSQPPPAITTDTTELPFDDSYKPACIDYVIYRCLIEETTIPNAQSKAQVFFNKFMQDLGLKGNVGKSVDAKD